MTDGDIELVQVVADLAVTLPAVVWAIVRDERRLTGAALERAWTPTSRDAAIFALFLMGVHPLAVVVHWTKTRASLAGFALGLACGVSVAALGVGAQVLAAGAVGVLGL